MDTELFKEWFQAFSQSAGITLHVWKIYMEKIVTIKLNLAYKGSSKIVKRMHLQIDPRKN